MREDVIKYSPFEDNFTLDVHKRYYSIKGAKVAEKAFIAFHHLLTDKGYNLLRGSPASSRLFWTMHNHGKLRSQRGRMAQLLPHLFNAYCLLLACWLHNSWRCSCKSANHATRTSCQWILPAESYWFQHTLTSIHHSKPVQFYLHGSINIL
jgi:hypothetical protein